MTPQEAFSALSALAKRAGLEVRVETFGHALAGKGGLCRVDGKDVILVDAKLGVLERVGVVGLALGRYFRERKLPIEVPPNLRSYLKTGHAELRRLPAPATPKPLARALRQRPMPPLRIVGGGTVNG